MIYLDKLIFLSSLDLNSEMQKLSLLESVNSFVKSIYWQNATATKEKHDQTPRCTGGSNRSFARRFQETGRLDRRERNSQTSHQGDRGTCPASRTGHPSPALQARRCGLPEW